MTTVRAAQASANGIRSLQKSKLQVRSLQEYHSSVLKICDRDRPPLRRKMKMSILAVFY